MKIGKLYVAPGPSPLRQCMTTGDSNEERGSVKRGHSVDSQSRVSVTVSISESEDSKKAEKIKKLQAKLNKSEFGLQFMLKNMFEISYKIDEVEKSIRILSKVTNPEDRLTIDMEGLREKSECYKEMKEILKSLLAIYFQEISTRSLAIQNIKNQEFRRRSV